MAVAGRYQLVEEMGQGGMTGYQQYFQIPYGRQPGYNFQQKLWQPLLWSLLIRQAQ